MLGEDRPHDPVSPDGAALLATRGAQLETERCTVQHELDRTGVRRWALPLTSQIGVHDQRFCIAVGLHRPRILYGECERAVGGVLTTQVLKNASEDARDNRVHSGAIGQVRTAVHRDRHTSDTSSDHRDQHTIQVEKGTQSTGRSAGLRGACDLRHRCAAANSHSRRSPALRCLLTFFDESTTRTRRSHHRRCRPRRWAGWSQQTVCCMSRQAGERMRERSLEGHGRKEVGPCRWHERAGGAAAVAVDAGADEAPSVEQAERSATSRADIFSTQHGRHETTNRERRGGKEEGREGREGREGEGRRTDNTQQTGVLA